MSFRSGELYTLLWVDLRNGVAKSIADAAVRQSI
jgi:hypothetical protein